GDDEVTVIVQGNARMALRVLRRIVLHTADVEDRAQGAAVGSKDLADHGLGDEVRVPGEEAGFVQVLGRGDDEVPGIIQGRGGAILHRAVGVIPGTPTAGGAAVDGKDVLVAQEREVGAIANDLHLY